MTGTHIGTVFSRVRRHRGLSQLQLSAKAGVHKNTISRLECGDAVYIETMICISQALQVPLSRMIKLAEKSSPDTTSCVAALIAPKAMQ